MTLRIWMPWYSPSRSASDRIAERGTTKLGVHHGSRSRLTLPPLSTTPTLANPGNRRNAGVSTAATATLAGQTRLDQQFGPLPGRSRIACRRSSSSATVTTASTRSPHHRPGQVAHAGQQAVGDRVRACGLRHPVRPAALEARRIIGAERFRGEQADRRFQRLRGQRDPRHQAAAADRGDDRVEIGDFLKHLQPNDGPLAGDDIRMIVRQESRIAPVQKALPAPRRP